MPWVPGRTAGAAKGDLTRGVVRGPGIRIGVRLDHGINDLRVALGDGQPDPALHGLGEATALDLGPGGAAVGALPQGTARAAALEEIGAPDPFPARRIEHVGVRGGHRDVDETRLVADELDELPGLAAVGGLVEA